MPLPRFQFSLRTLFYFVTAAAVCAALSRQIGWLEAMALFATVSVFAASIFWRRPHWTLRVGAAAFAMIATWIISVDKFQFLEVCGHHCGQIRFVQQYRILHFPVYEWEHVKQSYFQMIAADLELKPCDHIPSVEVNQCRWWGLMFLEFHNGHYTFWFDDEENYQTRLQPQMLKMLKEDPNLRNEFLQAFENSDATKLHAFVTNLSIHAGPPLPQVPNLPPNNPDAPTSDGADDP